MSNTVKRPSVLGVNYVIYVLLALLTVVLTWSSVITLGNTDTLQELPDNYVRLERYQSDTKLLYDRLERIETKLDKLIERQ